MRLRAVYAQPLKSHAPRTRIRRMSRLAVRAPVGALLCAAIVTGGWVATPTALSARNHLFAGTYTGRGHGGVTGNTASGSGTAIGRGTGIGSSRLSGSARGVFTSRTCVTFSGTAVLAGRNGSITLAARSGLACAGAADADVVAFSGSAR